MTLRILLAALPGVSCTTLRHLLLTAALSGLVVPLGLGAQERAEGAAVGDTVTLDSGLRYVFLQRGDGPRPEVGSVMVIHGIGRLTDGTEFWNTRTEGSPWEYTFGVDRVIAGFEEGMQFVREGDRIEITMPPELAYGEQGREGIPPNSTLVFDYEILSVHPPDRIP